MWERIERFAMLLGPTIIFVQRIRSGIQHRRGSWLRRDWIRFGLLLGVPVSIIAIALAMGFAVDRGIYDVIPTQYHKLYLGTLLTLALVGSGSLGGVLGWFAFPEIRSRAPHNNA